MADRKSMVRRAAAVISCAAALAVTAGPRTSAQAPVPPPGALRLHGLVEAVEFFGVVAPSGRNGQLTIVRIAPKGTTVKKGDLVIEFDRQVPLREAIDKQAEWKQLEEDIRKKQAEIKLQDAVDDTTVKTAENDLALARLETTKNDVLPRIDAEKNTLNLAGGRGQAARSPQVDRAEARGRRRRARHPRAEAGSCRARPGPRHGDGGSAPRRRPDRRPGRAADDLEGRQRPGRARGRRRGLAGHRRSSTSSARVPCASGSR